MLSDQNEETRLSRAITKLCARNGSLARVLFIPSVRFKSMGHLSAQASPLGPSLACDKMTFLDVLNSARLKPRPEKEEPNHSCAVLSFLLLDSLPLLL